MGRIDLAFMTHRKVIGIVLALINTGFRVEQMDFHCDTPLAVEAVDSLEYHHMLTGIKAVSKWRAKALRRHKDRKKPPSPVPDRAPHRAGTLPNLSREGSPEDIGT
jgi:hypothetical protein